MRGTADKTDRLYDSLVTLTGKWWLYGLLFLAVFIPPWSSTTISSFAELKQLVEYIAEFLIAKKLVLVPYMPFFHLAMLLWFGALFNMEEPLWKGFFSDHRAAFPGDPVYADWGDHR